MDIFEVYNYLIRRLDTTILPNVNRHRQPDIFVGKEPSDFPLSKYKIAGNIKEILKP